MDITQRDRDIAVEFLGGRSVPKLALKHGLSEPHINRILEQQQVDRSKRLKSSTEDKIIDHAHERIGQRLYSYRSFEAFEDRMTCAKNIGWSAKKLAMVEQGHTVLNLTELQAIAKYMKQTISQLLEDL